MTVTVARKSSVDVACPKCGRGPGDWCVRVTRAGTPSKALMRLLHTERVTLWRESQDVDKDVDGAEPEPVPSAGPETTVSWWPPKVGDKLRYYHNDTDYLVHVVAVFEHAQDRHHPVSIVIAYYGKHKQWWHYEVANEWAAGIGAVRHAVLWPDGGDPPEWLRERLTDMAAEDGALP